MSSRRYDVISALNFTFHHFQFKFASKMDSRRCARRLHKSITWLRHCCDIISVRARQQIGRSTRRELRSWRMRCRSRTTPETSRRNVSGRMISGGGRICKNDEQLYMSPSMFHEDLTKSWIAFITNSSLSFSLCFRYEASLYFLAGSILFVP